MSLVGEAKIAKVFIWKTFGSPPRVTLPSKRVSLHPNAGSPGPSRFILHFCVVVVVVVVVVVYVC